MLANWHGAVTLQSTLLALPAVDDFVMSQPENPADLASCPCTDFDCCIGHSPAKPVAASPLKGSITQSSRTKKVRSTFMGWD